MNRLIRAERLKLTTVRTYWMLALGVTALIAAGVAVTAATTKFDAGTKRSPVGPTIRKVASRAISATAVSEGWTIKLGPPPKMAWNWFSPVTEKH